MESVFIVSAGVDYEGSSPVRAFAIKDQAEEFATKCREYNDTRPRFPMKGGNQEIAEWSAAEKEWKAAHPGGEASDGADYFVVHEVPFVATQIAEGE